MIKKEIYEWLDKPVNRIGSDCAKWDQISERFGVPDLLPLWVADMDFPSPKEVTNAFIDRAKHGLFGYTNITEEDKDAVCHWMLHRHQCHISPENVIPATSVLSSMYYSLKLFVNPGDRVAIFTPIYCPFFLVIQDCQAIPIEVPLIHGFSMDLNRLEAEMKLGVKVLLLCSPHNPTGRIWKKEELTNLVNLCNRYHVQIICDETHCDFELFGHIHTPILTIKGAESSILLISASKTFNISGLCHSSVIIPDSEIRKKLENSFQCMGYSRTNLFGSLAQRIAYRTGEDWLDTVIQYLEDNHNYCIKFIESEIPKIKCTRPDGTYLEWLNFNHFGFPQENIMELLIYQARILLQKGSDFGSNGT